MVTTIMEWQEILVVNTELADKISNVHRIFKACINNATHVFLAYSGGKDSTALAILLYEWLQQQYNNRPENITIVHNDTLSEINPMEEWTRTFMNEYAERLKDLGIQVHINMARPKIIDTFYWRVIIRGYPAPTFNFRWCVELLKIQPSRSTIKTGGIIKINPTYLHRPLV